MEDRAIAYYDRCASAYCAATRSLDMSALYAPFLARVASGGRILDLGCGSGRDSLAFLSMGYAVTAADGSPAMCAAAAALTGLPVRCLRFDELDEQDAYEGIWACGSLLHAPRADMPRIASKLCRALVPGGTLYASFKLGDADREQDGRPFTDYTPEALCALFSPETGWNPPEIALTDDVRPENPQRWVNLLVSKSHKR